MSDKPIPSVAPIVDESAGTDRSGRLIVWTLIVAVGAGAAWLYFGSAAARTTATVYRLAADRKAAGGKTFLNFAVAADLAVADAALAGRLRDILDAGSSYEVRVSDDFPYEYGLSTERGGRVVQALFSPRDGKLLIVEDDPLTPDLRFLSRAAATDLAGILHSLVGSADSPKK